MDIDNILKLVETLLQPEQFGQIERFIFQRSWIGQTYDEMAQGSGYGSVYIKEIGSRLWQNLSEALGKRVTKKNLHLVFNQFEIEQPTNLHQPSIEFPKEQGELSDRLFERGPIFPSHPVPFDSPLYISRPPIEELVYSEMRKPGCLIRIKAPRKMGKSSLLNRVLAQAIIQRYKTVYLDLQEADASVLASLDKFLRWFCINISRRLNLDPQLNTYWDEEMGSKVSCRIYFENYLLRQTNQPLVLVINEVNRVFEYDAIAQDFLPMLRFWHEQSCQVALWRNFRMVVAHSTEIYVPLRLNQSPFNVGLSVTLPPFTLDQSRHLALRYGFDWTTSEDKVQQLMRLHSMTGGHPYLMSLALYYLGQESLTFETLMDTAATHTGIYSDHLRSYLALLRQEPELQATLQQVIHGSSTAQLDAIAAYRLESLGLIQLDGYQAKLSCDLYCQYFKQQFS